MVVYHVGLLSYFCYVSSAKSRQTVFTCSCRSATLVRVCWESSSRYDIYFTYLRHLAPPTAPGRRRLMLPPVIPWRWTRPSASSMTSYPSTCVKLWTATTWRGTTRYNCTSVVSCLEQFARADIWDVVCVHWRFLSTSNASIHSLGFWQPVVGLGEQKQKIQIQKLVKHRM